MKKFTDYALQKIKEQANLTDVDIFLIENWFDTRPGNDPYDPDIKILDFLSAQARRQVYKHLHDKAIRYVWDKGSLNLLKAIINKTQFFVSYGDEVESLPREMLPERFSSFDSISSTDPRAEIAKKLGMTIVVK